VVDVEVNFRLRRGVTTPDVESAFVAFYVAEFDGAARLAHLLTGRDDIAEDLAQDAMTRVHKHFDELDNPAAYLRTSVVNRCRNWHRSITRERARQRRVTTIGSQLPPEVDDLLNVVDRLPYRQRTVIVMRYWLDLSESEIAAHLRCRPGTVKSLAARSMDRLRRELS
jgi:RNA polymerase sigma factor (sigma-70 family)